MMDNLNIDKEVAYFRPRGSTTLVDAVEMVANAISACREQNVVALFVDPTGLTDVSIPTLVDRFLAVEEWVHRSQSVVTVAMVLSEKYMHPEKFGVKVARDFGLVMDVFSPRLRPAVAVTDSIGRFRPVEQLIAKWQTSPTAHALWSFGA